MSRQRLAASLGRPALRFNVARRYLHHHPASSAGGLHPIRPSATSRYGRRRAWPFGAISIHEMTVVRNVSFARILPNLALKLVRIPAMFGAALIGGVAYIQYQAAQAGSYALDILGKGKDMASGAAGGLFEGAKGTFAQTMNGWEKTKESIEMPAWLQGIFAGGEKGSSGDGPNGDRPPNQSRVGGTVVAGTGAAFGYTLSPEEDERSPEAEARDDQMMVLTKKMIEIRSILQVVGQSDALTLPSIVVIGSQSSGKSSVLEAIVGHEFLPKGSNMITRRPIELTLVNTPDAQAEYGEFPALRLGKITDFSNIQKTLTDLNLAVPANDCVSDDPIQLSIYSPNVPDLSLIDLPGYIQVSGEDQPPELKQKIADLCDRYIQPPNVILAISAADVDLANSTALRASRRVDPRGERTIGVVTKMDLVEPDRGAAILSDRKYPLRLGYVGVVSRIPPAAGGLFSRGSGNITKAITKNENAYFSAHLPEFGPESDLAVGTTTLRKKLMHVLERSMAASLQGTSEAIHRELEEATYEFKVQYNDRPLSAESYLDESLDAFKHSFKEFAESFGRPQLRELLKEVLDQKVLNELARHYWNAPVKNLSPALIEPHSLSDLPRADPRSPYWRHKLDMSSDALTKLGFGRLATNVVEDALQSEIDRLISASPFSSHPFARQAIIDASSEILNDRHHSTSDQVENIIKPYKIEIEVDDLEWSKGRQHSLATLRKELKDCEAAQKRVESFVGGKRKLKDLMGFIDRVRNGEVDRSASGFSDNLLGKGRDAVFLRDRASIIQMRLAAIQSRQCSQPPPSTDTSLSDPPKPNTKYTCPEIFLDVVASQLTTAAVLFLNVELLKEFYHDFPRELDRKLGRGLSTEDVERFAREDPRVARHLDVVKRKELLEMVLEKMEALKTLDGRERRREGERSRRDKDGAKKGWSLF